MKKITLVILYNKKISESTTLRSLLLTKYYGELVIFNNGPIEISSNCSIFHELEHLCSSVILEQDVSNRPLSMVYNQFLSRAGYNNYFIFDDDTCIPPDFFSSKENKVCDLSLPVIISDRTNDIFYPIINSKPYNFSDSDISDKDDFISIGSGLMINDSLIDIFKENEMQLFDERFALYGVDYSLFRRISILKKIDVPIKIDVSGCLVHSLSSEDEKISKFRQRERLIDVMLTKLHYSERKGISKFLSLGKTLLKNFLAVGIHNGMTILLVLIYKEHPRSHKIKK